MRVRLKTLIYLPVLGILLCALGVLSGCESNEPPQPRLYNEQDSIALCAIMAEAPMCKADKGGWLEGDVHSLSPEFRVAWERVEGETSLRITGLEMVSSNPEYYSEDGILSEAIGQLTYLKRLKLEGYHWSGDMPASLGSLGNIEVLEIRSTHFTKLPQKLDLRKAYDVVIKGNSNFHHLCEGFEDFGVDVPYYFYSPKSLEVTFNNFEGTIPIVKETYVTINFESNIFTSADIKELLYKRYLSFNANYNCLTGEIPEELLESRDAIRDITKMFGIQRKGYGLSNLPLTLPSLQPPVVE